jgi:putative membrane protein
VDLTERNYLEVKKTTPYYNVVRRIAFPSIHMIIAILVLLDVGGCALAFYIFRGTIESISQGIATGLLTLALPTFVVDLLARFWLLRRDRLFFLRRCFALSLFSSIVWIFSYLTGAILTRLGLFYLFPIQTISMAIFLVIPLRTISLMSMSEAKFWRRTVTPLIQPAICLAASVAFFRGSFGWALNLFVFSSLLGFTFSSLVIFYVEVVGYRVLGYSPLRIFRAFLIDWLDGDFSDFEAYLENFAVPQTIRLNVFSFRSIKSGQTRASIIISNFHPGPFLNVGSSVLPYILQRVFSKVTDAPALVPHGISGHELNLVSQDENEKVVREAFKCLQHPSIARSCTPIQTTRVGYATAKALAFGDVAIVTLTTSPSDMEDIPLNLRDRVMSVAPRVFRETVLIDAHNCINKTTIMDEQKISDLTHAAVLALKACAASSQSIPRVGAATIHLPGISMRDGFGPGGIVALLIETDGSYIAYLVFDGNNMVSGLRERILDELKKSGINGEVMTTDTHMVNGLVAARLGYHPVGEAIDLSVILESIRRVIDMARNDMEEVEVWIGCTDINVRILGLSSLSKLTAFLHRVAKMIALAFAGIIIVAIAISFSIPI